jgi:hypothetical protein
MTKPAIEQWAVEKAAQLWCLPEHSNKVMDVAFAESISISLQEVANKRDEEIKELKEELEKERLRLSGCGVAALGYFDGCNDEYKSASLSDVLELRRKFDELQSRLELVKTVLESAQSPEYTQQYLWNIIQSALKGDGEMNKEVSLDHYMKYRKPTGCSYPFHTDGISYCWGYALRVDKGTEKDMNCAGCEFNTNKESK